MPQTKSAKKALRQAGKKRLVNLAVLKKLKNEVKNFRKDPKSNSFAKVQSIIDRAAKKNIFSKNKAARLKSRLSKLFSKTGKETKQISGLTKRKNKGKLKKTTKKE